MAGPVEVGDAEKEEERVDEEAVVRDRVEVVRVEESLDELLAAREEGERVFVVAFVLVGFDEVLDNGDELVTLELEYWLVGFNLTFMMSGRLVLKARRIVCINIKDGEYPKRTWYHT